MIEERPAHQHDCDQCVFLGNHYHGGSVTDLYYCSHINDDNNEECISFICRSSSEPSDNAASSFFPLEKRDRSRLMGGSNGNDVQCQILYGWGTTHAYLWYVYVTEGMEGVNKLYQEN